MLENLVLGHHVCPEEMLWFIPGGNYCSISLPASYFLVCSFPYSAHSSSSRLPGPHAKLASLRLYLDVIVSAGDLHTQDCVIQKLNVREILLVHFVMKP